MKNKKKKQLPLLLLALLFITAAAYGTRAYFTDQATQNAGIKLTLGNLSIDPAIEDAVVWNYTPIVGSNDNIKTEDVIATETGSLSEFKDVQPGDAFTGTFTFQNTGTLDQIVTTTNNLSTENSILDIQISKDISVLEDETQKGESVIVEPQENVIVIVTVVVKTDDTFNATHNNTTENVISDSSIVAAINGAITVNAVQTNK